MRLWVRFLALLSGLRIWRCCELWYRLEATAPIRPLAWEPPCTTGAAPPQKKRERIWRFQIKHSRDRHTGTLGSPPHGAAISWSQQWGHSQWGFFSPGYSFFHLSPFLSFWSPLKAFGLLHLFKSEVQTKWDTPKGAGRQIKSTDPTWAGWWIEGRMSWGTVCLLCQVKWRPALGEQKRPFSS